MSSQSRYNLIWFVSWVLLQNKIKSLYYTLLCTLYPKFKVMVSLHRWRILVSHPSVAIGQQYHLLLKNYDLSHQQL